jgi:hypothetical protein
VPVIGEIDFHLTHIELASFTIGACNATFAAPEGVGVTVSDLAIKLTLDWQLRRVCFELHSNPGTFVDIVDIDVSCGSRLEYIFRFHFHSKVLLYRFAPYKLIFCVNFPQVQEEGLSVAAVWQGQRQH